MRRLATSKDMIFEQSLSKKSSDYTCEGCGGPIDESFRIDSINSHPNDDGHYDWGDDLCEKCMPADTRATDWDDEGEAKIAAEDNPRPGPPDEAKGQEEAPPKRGRPPGTKNRTDYTKMVDGIEGKPQGPVGAPKPGRTPTPVPLPEDESDREEALYMRVRQILEG